MSTAILQPDLAVVAQATREAGPRCGTGYGWLSPIKRAWTHSWALASLSRLCLVPPLTVLRTTAMLTHPACVFTHHRPTCASLLVQKSHSAHPSSSFEH